MKKLFLTPIVFALVFTFGCQETSITDPLITVPEESQYQGSELELTKNSNNAIKNGSIALKRILSDPARRTSCKLGGKVKYSILKIFDDEEETLNFSRKDYVKVVLEMSSILCPLGPTDDLPTEIEGESVDILFFDPTSSVNFLKKTYQVTNRTDVVVFVTYEIGPSYLKVDDVKLNAIETQN